MGSFAMATALVPTLGYRKVSELVKHSLSEQKPFLELVVENNLLASDEIDQLIRDSV